MEMEVFPAKLPATHFSTARGRGDDCFKSEQGGQDGGEGSQCKLKGVAVDSGLTGLRQRWQCAPQSRWDLGVFPKASREGGGLRKLEA